MRVRIATHPGMPDISFSHQLAEGLCRNVNVVTFIEHCMGKCWTKIFILVGNDIDLLFESSVAEFVIAQLAIAMAMGTRPCSPCLR